MPVFNSSKNTRRGGRPARNTHRLPRRAGRNGRSAGRGRPGNNGAKMAAAIIAPLVALGAASYGAIALLDGEEADANHCYDRDDQHQSVVFVDNSIVDQSGAQMRDYRTGLIQVWDNAPANAQIRIASTDRTTGGSFAQPQFTICKPAANPAEQEAIGAPSQTAPMLKRIAGEARGKYEAMVEQIIANASDPSKTALDSPILEQLQAISKYPGFTGPNRSLATITDGINNSETARFCMVKGALVPFEKFKKKRGYKYIEPDSFEGVEVTIMLVERGKLPAPGAPYCSNDDVRDFWPEYFKGNGAASVDLRRLRYWQDS